MVHFAAMRASRLLTILITLQLRGRVTAQKLADELEVSKRTIYRDIDELSAAGVPVYADRGRDGGFSLLDGFRTQLTGLTASETEALLIAGVPAAAVDLGLSRAASDAQLKLLASLPPASRGPAERVAQRFHLDVADWYRRPTAPDCLATISKALWEQFAVELDYESWTRTARSRIEPLGLILKAGRWYLVARRAGKTRTFRLDKIRSARLLDERFEYPADFDLGVRWRDSVEAFEQSLHRESATLRIAPSMIDHLDRFTSDIADPLRAAEPDAQGWRQATVRIEGSAHAATLLLGFGDSVEVLAPAALREELRNRAAAVLRLYANDRDSKGSP